MDTRTTLAAQRRAELEALCARADYLTGQAAHYERESLKLQEWRRRRVEVIMRQAQYAEDTRITVDFTAEDIAYAWNSNDPKLAEYSAGMVIVERRAQMYAAMAAEVRLQIQIHMQVFPESYRSQPTARTPL